MNRRAKIVIVVLTVLLVMETIWLGTVVRQAWIAQVEQRRLEAQLAVRWPATRWMDVIDETVTARESCCADMPASLCDTVTCDRTDAGHDARVAQETRRVLMPGPKDCTKAGEDWTSAELDAELKRALVTGARSLPAILHERARLRGRERCEAFNAAVARDARR
jgi:hypothetical protein